MFQVSLLLQVCSGLSVWSFLDRFWKIPNRFDMSWLVGCLLMSYDLRTETHTCRQTGKGQCLATRHALGPKIIRHHFHRGVFLKHGYAKFIQNLTTLVLQKMGSGYIWRNIYIYISLYNIIIYNPVYFHTVPRNLNRDQPRVFFLRVNGSHPLVLVLWG